MCLHAWVIVGIQLNVSRLFACTCVCQLVYCTYVSLCESGFCVCDLGSGFMRMALLKLLHFIGSVLFHCVFYFIMFDLSWFYWIVLLLRVWNPGFPCYATRLTIMWVKASPDSRVFPSVQTTLYIEACGLLGEIEVSSIAWLCIWCYCVLLEYEKVTMSMCNILCPSVCFWFPLLSCQVSSLFFLPLSLCCCSVWFYSICMAVFICLSLTPLIAMSMCFLQNAPSNHHTTPLLAFSQLFWRKVNISYSISL